jgi:mannitol/fructose-specific phosphotransferase system IIA component (Ntr-type)
MKSNNWEKYRPTIVSIEDHEYDASEENISKISTFLVDKGYVLDSKCRYTLIFRHKTISTQ